MYLLYKNSGNNIIDIGQQKKFQMKEKMYLLYMYKDDWKLKRDNTPSSIFWIILLTDCL